MTPIPTFFSRLKTATMSAVDVFSTSFAGANDSGTRTSTAGTPFDTRKEVTFYTRVQLIKKSRWLCNNLGLMRRFINGVSRYAVGGGISHIPATRDEDWNELADTYFTDWANEQLLCDVRGRLNFWRMQKSVLRSMFRDGDCFVLKAPTKESVTAGGRTIIGAPRLQWLESHRVGSVNQSSYVGDVDAEGYWEGLKFNDEGMATSYKILIDTNNRTRDLGKVTTREANDVMHILDDERASQVRGLPWIYHGVNSAIDILDLTSLEKVAVKLHSQIGAAIKKKTGDAGRGGFTGNLSKQRGRTEDGKKKVVAYENFMGAAGILQLDLDEEFQFLTSNRPSQTFEGFIDFLVRDMAWGFGVSPEFIWSVAGLSGPNARLILEDAKWFFEEIQDLLVSLFCKKVYTWVIARAMERGELPMCKDDRWWICDWIGPAKITIDQGREGQLELDRLNNGCGTWEEYWATRGKSGRKQVRKRIDEIADAMEYAKEKVGPGHEEGVPFDYIIALKPGAMSPGQQLDENAKGLDKVKRSQPTDDNQDD